MTTLASGRFISPVFQDFPDAPEQQQAGGGAGGINANIRDERCARKDKDLMKLVAGGIDKDVGERQSRLVPAPWTEAVVAFLRPPDRAPEEQGEHGIFGQMGRFAEEMMKEFDVAIRYLRKQPAD